MTGSGEVEATIAAYENGAQQYRDATASMPPTIAAAIERYSDSLSHDAEVLEIGSGPGRDATALEAQGLRVRRTDITSAFVEMLRADGHRATQMDPLADDLGGPCDGVWCSAVVVHLDRADAARLAQRLYDVTRPGGQLFLSAKEGDGGAWSETGNLNAPRHFTYWGSDAFGNLLSSVGWTVDELRVEPGPGGGSWLHAYATRPVEVG
ncbi:methyltransferase type 12 [Flexivirga endophytica]|uniref:Methyltransferase type 12 n=1 Tax=Flexivirga endophytica TaxID=1849103 RepID=A0A916WXD3_9MICO|nr:class I SAM-dependent methyltransferase [Flexivirga endophytica]GGB37346.1 methyltransferase type 12 [Flexivirga endophytica]GHB44923.1 methyltransferase type 12 [Flexivirga endophytica]